MRAWLAVVVIGVAALASAPIAAAAEGAKSTDLRIGYNGEIDYHANIFAAFNGIPYLIFTEIYDTLVSTGYDGTEDLKTSLVDSYDKSPDGLVYTWHLKHDLKWSDGQPLNADDVVFSWEQAPNSNVNSSYLEFLDKVEKVDDSTVRTMFTKPDARVWFLYVPIVPKHLWEKHTGDELVKWNPCCPMVGSGPFFVSKIDDQGTTILEPNPYWNRSAKPQAKRVLLIKYADEESQLRDVKLGKLDATYSGNDLWVKTEAATPHVKVWSSVAVGFQEIAFNMCPPGGKGSGDCTGPGKDVNVKVVQDPAIRKALAWGIDRRNLVRVAYHGVGSPGNGLISPYYKARGYYKDWSTDPVVGYGYAPEKARAILAEGGWSCPTGGTCTKDGVKAQFELLVRNSTQEDINAAKRIASWAKDLGIKIDLSYVTSDAINEKIYHSSPTDENRYEPTYDAFMWSWAGDAASPDYVMSVLRCTTNGTSDSMYCNPKYDDLVSKSLFQTDFKKRVDLMHQAERIALADAPYIFTIHSNDITATRTDTWTDWRPFGGPTGQPFSYTATQLVDVRAGAAAKASYSGAPLAIAVLGGAGVVIVAIGAIRRRRENHGPLELPVPAKATS